MGTKTSQLQIRVSPGEKAMLKRLAAEAGLSVSAYVLATVLPSIQVEFSRRIAGLRGSGNHAGVLAELHLFLSELTPEVLAVAVADTDVDELPILLRNYVAASVEQACHRWPITPPAWVDAVPPLDRPDFAWDLRSLRPHLMRVTPLAFKRRNVFIAAHGDARL